MEEQADALLIAGDIYQTSNPPASAEQLFYDFLGEMRRRVPDTTLVVIAGNHDSAARLEAAAALYRALDVHVVGAFPFTADAGRATVHIQGRHGQAYVAAVPFLRPSDLRPSLVRSSAPPAPTSTTTEQASLVFDASKDEASGATPTANATSPVSAPSPESAEDPDVDPTPTEQSAAPSPPTDDASDAPDGLRGVAAGVAERYAAAQSHIASIRGEEDFVILMGHGHMAATTESKSERKLVRADAEALPASVFGAAYDYAALGHLHLAQPVEGCPAPTRYSGSPIPLSMAEASYPHQILRVDLDHDTPPRIAALRVPRTVELIRFQVADPQGVEETLAALKAYDFGEPPEDALPYLEVGVFLEKPTPDLNERITTALEGKPVRLLKITPKRAPSLDTRLGDRVLDRDLSDLDPEDVLIAMHQAEHDAPPSEALLQAFRTLRAEVDGGASKRAGRP